MPFENLSNDPDQEYFADGVTDDLTSDLSRISGSFVISRTTAFTYKGKAVDVRQIGRDLGVRYVLEGSVRRSGDQVHVNVQLIDADSRLAPLGGSVRYRMDERGESVERDHRPSRPYLIGNRIRPCLSRS